MPALQPEQQKRRRPLAGVPVLMHTVLFQKKGGLLPTGTLIKPLDRGGQFLVRLCHRKRQRIVVYVKRPLLFQIRFPVRCKQQRRFPHKCRLKQNTRIIGNKYIAGGHKLLTVLVPAHINHRDVMRPVFSVFQMQKRRMPSEQNLPLTAKTPLQLF